MTSPPSPASGPPAEDGVPAGLPAADGPSIARVYDYLLGGSHNFAADRAAARGFLTRWPDAQLTMLANRAFLGRAVRFLAAEAGIGQFLDIGSGIPTMGNVHEIARQAPPVPASSMSTTIRSPCCTARRSWPATATRLRSRPTWNCRRHWRHQPM
jgi:hypothetical protein